MGKATASPGVGSRCGWVCKHLSPTNRWAVLLAWAFIHTTIIWALLFVLDTELARAHQHYGLHATATQLLLVLFSCNLGMYLSIWASDPGFVELPDKRKQHVLQEGPKQQQQQRHGTSSPFEDAFSRSSIVCTAFHQMAYQRRDSSSSGSSPGSSGMQSGNAYDRLLPLDQSTDAELAVSADQHDQQGLCCTCCGASRPLRSRHCRHCGRCVASFDHHCFWVGTCIGAANHARFWGFLGCQTAIVVFGLHQTLTALRHQAQGTPAPTWHDGHQLLAPVLTLFQMVVFLVVGGLLFLHSLLIVFNQTTFEAFERQRVPYLANIPSGISPFDKGPLSNVWHFFCARELYDAAVDWQQQQAKWPMTVAVLVDNDLYSCC